jgi:AcrR family transcriptional regulator
MSGMTASEGTASEGTAPGVRARVREELTLRIVATARRHLATEGAAGLSLRAVARELGMASSAVYRYVSSRDELLTLLIVDAYDALGEAVERAEAKIPRDELFDRYLAICTSARRWALRNPHEFALIFGSPVPGYAAPETTVEPAARVGRVLIGLLGDSVAAGVAAPAEGPLTDTARRAIAPIRPVFPAAIPDELVFAGIVVWSHLIGSISFELFGHTANVVADAPALRAAFHLQEMTLVGRRLGLLPPG